MAPKREALRKADKDYQSLMAELRKKQDALRGVQEELAGLQAELDTVKKEKMELEQTVSIIIYLSFIHVVTKEFRYRGDEVIAK